MSGHRYTSSRTLKYTRVTRDKTIAIDKEVMNHDEKRQERIESISDDSIRRIYASYQLLIPPIMISFDSNGRSFTYYDKISKIISILPPINEGTNMDIRSSIDKLNKRFGITNIQDAAMYIVHSSEGNIFNMINLYLFHSGERMFTNKSTYETSYSVWLSKLNKIMENTCYSKIRISNIQRLLLDVPSSKKETLNDNVITIPIKGVIEYIVAPNPRYRPNWSISDIPSIINNTIVSTNIPFVMHRSQKSHGGHGDIFKVFHLIGDNNNYNYRNVYDFTQSTFDPDSIYFYVWNGANVNQNSSYIECALSITTMIMEVRGHIPHISISDKRQFDDIINESIKFTLVRLREALPFYEFIRGFDKHMNAKLHYRDHTVNVSMFHYMIDHDEVIRSYLTNIETSNKRYDVKNVEVNFQNIICDSPVSVLNFSNLLSDEGSYFVVKIKGADSRKTINTIRTIMSYILLRYDKLYKSYESMIAETVPDVVKLTWAQYDVPDDKRIALIQASPELFGGDSKYASECQCVNQPLIIRSEEIDSWKQMRIDGSNDRIIGEYPPPEHANIPESKGVKRQFYYVCPDDNYPYPYLKSTTFDNSIPCCNKLDRWTEYINKGTGPISEYYVDKKRAKIERIFKTPNVLERGQYAFVPEIVNTHLSMSVSVDEYITDVYSITSGYTETDVTDEEKDVFRFIRLGVSDNLNDSFIDCVLNATGSKLTNREVRQSMYKLPMETYAQENVGNLSQHELKDIILNESLNPSLFYRGLEVLFSINIFVFSSETKDILMPMNRLVHLRQNRVRSVVLIWYHVDKKVCELIVKSTEHLREIVKLFDERMNNRMMMMIDDNFVVDVNGFVAKNASGSVDIEGFAKEFKATQQYIDRNGKCRGLNVISPSGELATVMFWPMQPLPLDSRGFNMTRISSNSARELMNMVGYHKDDNIYFNAMGIDGFFHIPVIMDTRREIGESRHDLRINRYAAERSNYKMTMTLIWWYVGMMMTPGMEMSNLWNELFEIKNGMWNNLKLIKDTDKLETNVSKVKSFMIDRLDPRQTSPNGKIYLNEIDYKMYKSFVIYKYCHLRSGTINNILYIKKNYTYSTDYKVMNSKVFLSISKLLTWISRGSNYTNGRIMNDVNLISGMPSIVSIDGRVYLVQSMNDKDSAICNGIQYLKTDVNILTPNFDDCLSDNIIVITRGMYDGEFQVIEIEGMIDDEAPSKEINIFRGTGGQIASMLRLN